MFSLEYNHLFEILNYIPNRLNQRTSEIVYSCLTLCDPMDYSLLGSSIHGIFQARVLEWVAISSSRVSSQPRDQTQVFCIAADIYCSNLCSLLIRILLKSGISSPCVILVLLLSLKHITIWLHFTSLQWNRAVGFKTTNGLNIAKSNNHISILSLFDLQRALDTVITPCCRLHICVSPKLICWNWMSNMIVLGCGNFERFLGHEGRDIMDEISVLIKETPQNV